MWYIIAVMTLKTILSDYYKTTCLFDDVWAIEDIKTSENTICYLICGHERALLFDTGLGISPLSPIVAGITNLPIIAVLSHWHFDHTGSASEFENIFGRKSGNMVDASSNGISSQSINKLIGPGFLESIGLTELNIKPFPWIQFLNANQAFDIGGYSFQILHTPGHTQDSICLYEAGKQWLFAGDTIYNGPIYLQFDDSDAIKYRTSVKNLVGYNVSVVFPGHNATSLSGDIIGEIDDMLTSGQTRSKIYHSLSLKTK